jgi:AraC family transcriptional regulator
MSRVNNMKPNVTAERDYKLHSSHRNYTDEIGRIVDQPPLLAPAVLRGDTRLTQRWVDAAVAAFGADWDTSRRYLLRESALFGVKRRARGAESTRRSERGGLLAWRLTRIVDYIERHLADKITAADLANLIEVSVTQLFRSFKISVGVTPCHYITRRRVELACTMLSTTRESLAQVAVGCGMCDQAHLSRVFRRMIGMSPSAWRREQQMSSVDNIKLGMAAPRVVAARRKNSSDSAY